ncbi:putative syja_n domain-containing protein [Rosellinia necatrix]|uniref:Putative syja_n domain-containing protein n=1 Tax=Rosellinia necatrix TaxID=77044 RepID=A0A1W2TRR4_ROSNE|nr:putative syja_n domain-containing protein [Rosellinia necatrix]
MPGLARKLLIYAAVDGLIIQPLASKGQTRTPAAVKVQYGDATLTSVSRDLPASPDSTPLNLSFEAFGIIGLFTVARLSYLITITGRQQVAQVRGYPVYVVTDVAVTPCANRNEAESAIDHTALKLRRALAEKLPEEVSDSESEVEALPSAAGTEDTDDPGAQSDREIPQARESGEQRSIAQDVFKKNGNYGRFAQKWFSNKGWMANRRQNLGLSGVRPAATVDRKDEDADRIRKESDDDDLSKTVVRETPDPPPGSTAGESLTPKLLRMAHIWFGTSKSFFFSYDTDLTRSLASQTAVGAQSPLYRMADPMFFWNQNLLKPFMALGDESLLLPLMQGFVGQRSFVVDQHPPQFDSQLDSVEMNDMTGSLPGSPPQERASFDLRPSEKKYVLTVVSRRSVKRAGLRYLRRGIDDEGFAANSVETEQILSTPSWEPSSKIYSFVQVRGSIPLFFTQSPWSLKPMPVLQHSPEANFRAFSKHFNRMSDKYGFVQLVNLIEKRGVEAIVGNEYQKMTEKYSREIPEGARALAFEWFDFHSACRGMKFENVSQLLDTLGKKIEKTGSTVELNGHTNRKQNGVLRTNCMDCLDRTNVCQSSFAKFVLDLQLQEEGFDMSTQVDQENSWFNTLWADNGDAISKQYASTAAMKGDYTRTRKRDYRGIVNDIGLSLTRFYNGMVNDYFSQAAIDFFLGNVTSLVFDEFEGSMKTKDPGVSMSKMRELAIETSQKIAIGDDKEDFIGGWTLLSPHTSDTIRTFPFEEVVLLLTDGALYLCRFDWNLDKVSSFERVDLAHVIDIKVGTYITSTISPTQADEAKNVGIVVTYAPGKTDVKRTNTRSLSSLPEQAAPKPPTNVLNQGILSSITGKPAAAAATGPRKMALKALYAHTAISEAQGTRYMTEAEQVNVIAAEIERLALAGRPPPPDKVSDGGNEGEARAGSGLVHRGDIISLEDAKRSTGLLEQLGHTIKKLVWA